MKKHLWFLVALLATPFVPFMTEAAEASLLARAGRYE